MGFLAYEFKKVIKAFPIAWQRATSWHPDFKRLRVYGKAFFYSMGFGLSMIVLTALFTSLLAISISGLPLSENDVAFILGGSLGALILALSFSFANAQGVVQGSKFSQQEELLKLKREALKYNPVTICIWYIPRLLTKGIWYLISHTPAGLWVFGHGIIITSLFFWQVFLIIHKDERLLCILGSAAGVMVGYYWIDNPLIGALIGGLFASLFGATSYEFFTKRLIPRLVPIKS